MSGGFTSTWYFSAKARNSAGFLSHGTWMNFARYSITVGSAEAFLQAW